MLHLINSSISIIRVAEANRAYESHKPAKRKMRTLQASEHGSTGLPDRGIKLQGKGGHASSNYKNNKNKRSREQDSLQRKRDQR